MSEQNKDIDALWERLKEAAYTDDLGNLMPELCGMLSELKDKRELLRWRSVKEELPEDAQAVLVEPANEYDILVFNAFNSCWDAPDTDDYYADVDDIAMWLPIPEYINPDE